MAATQQDIDTLKLRVESLNQAIDDGVRQVTLGDQTITYNTTDSLIRARDDAITRLAKMTSEVTGKPVPRQTKLYHAGRGFW